MILEVSRIFVYNEMNYTRTKTIESERWWRMKKSARYLRWLLILLAMIIVLQDRIPAFGKEARTVRVGFFSCNGFQDVGQDGSLSGFGYDYLEAVSQYMGWKMDYVTGYSLEDCLEMLKQGKIDLVNGVYKTAARQVDYGYPEVNVGTSTSCLITSQENEQIRYGDYASMDHETVGLLKGSSANDDFFTFSKEKGIDFNVVYYESANEVYDKIDRKEIDMALITSMQKSEGYRVIAKFAPHTFYMVTNKSNQSLLDELNRGMSSLKIYQPEFENMLEDRYYLNKDGIQPGLTDEERSYVKENPVIKVFCDPNWYPIERFNPRTGIYEGIAADVFREISKSTGLRFEFVKSANFTEALEQKIHFQVDLEIDEQEYYKIDKLRLQQILLNILSNSVKYTPSGGFIELKIQEIRRSSDRVTHQFMIRDNGEGMSEEFQNKVFQPFEQEKNKKIVGETGTGLGLAICKRLVEMMGGTISFQSKKSQGTTFFVVIESELASIREMNRTRKKAIHEIGDVLSGKRVLIAEDQPMNVQIISMILKKAGMVVEIAENGQEALDAFNDHPPYYYDVILMDVRMPVMDGLLATERIRQVVREDAVRIPIIAMTANAFESDIKMCIQSGMNAHLSKPIEPQRLFQVLSGWVKQTHKDPWPDCDDPENENEVTETIDN